MEQNMTPANTAGVPAHIAQAVLAEVERGADETIAFLRELVNFKTENPNLVVTTQPWKIILSAAHVSAYQRVISRRRYSE
jgi:hypothetical protein